MLNRKFLSLAFCLSLFFASQCRAWNSTGHEIVAQIAFDQLSPATKTAIIAILKAHPRLNEDLLHDEVRAKDDDLAMFLRAATWPDMIRYPAHPLTHIENHPRWHYVDFPIDVDGVTGPQPALQWDGHSDPANLVEAFQKARAELKNPQTAADRKAIDICWVEHLVGDIHQPLHAVSWFSKEFPNGDQGGNLDVIRLPNTEVVNLHFYWDNLEGMSLDPQQIRQTATRIETAHPASELKTQIADLSIVDWAKESFAIAKTAVYLSGALPHTHRSPGSTLPSDAPSLAPGYAESSLAVADARIALAGYRLAAVLDQIAAGK
jgi:hypothetical protein